MKSLDFEVLTIIQKVMKIKQSTSESLSLLYMEEKQVAQARCMMQGGGTSGRSTSCPGADV